MKIDGATYAARFRDLAEQFGQTPKTTTDKAAKFRDLQLRSQAGELFIDAVRTGHFRALPGAAEIVGEFDDCQIRAKAGVPVAFVDGRCELWPDAPARRSACAVMLFVDVAGEELIGAFNNAGELRPTRTLPPAGLLPDAMRGMFPGSQFPTLMLGASNPDEWADFRRLADAETRDRHGLACKLLAAILDAETPPAGDSETEKPGKSGGNSSPGSAPPKILAALLAHHKYDSGGCSNFDPIGARELAQNAGRVGAGSVSKFWKDNFGAGDTPGDYEAYKRSCVTGRIPFILSYLNGDTPPSDVLQAIEDDIRQRIDREGQ